MNGRAESNAADFPQKKEWTPSSDYKFDHDGFVISYTDGYGNHHDNSRFTIFHGVTAVDVVETIYIIVFLIIYFLVIAPDVFNWLEQQSNDRTEAEKSWDLVRYSFVPQP